MAPSPERRATGTATIDPEADGEATTLAGSAFRVSLEVFDGPFDLLLQLISKHELDITDVALSRVTDEFIRYLSDLETAEELERASEFIVVAATLLDMKIVSLLPQGEYVDAEAVAVLEARDLLFARLLQYRAFKEAAGWFRDRLGLEDGRHPRAVPLEAKFREVVPPLDWRVTLADFAAFAAAAFAPRTPLEVGLDHLHAPLVSIREQATLLVERLRDGTPRTFGELIADADAPGVVVARFLALLELYRRNALRFDQPEPLGTLTVAWDAPDWHDGQLATLGADLDR